MCVSLPVRILEVADDRRSASADSGGRTVRIGLDLLLLEGVALTPGDWVLANAGSAVAVLGEDEARDLLEPFGEETS